MASEGDRRLVLQGRELLFRERVFHPEDVERLREERQQALSRPVPFSNEQRVLGRDGRFRWFLIHYNPLLDADGREPKAGHRACLTR